MKTKKIKQRMHANSVAKKALKNKRRRKLLVSFWNKHGGQLKAITQQTMWKDDKVVEKFLNQSDDKESINNETIEINESNTEESDTTQDNNE